jgi:hypothetical protein
MMPDDQSSGEIYREHVGKLFAAEFERRAVLEARGDSIIKTSAGIITLIVALAVFISGNDYKFTNHWDSVWILAVSLLTFVISAAIAIYVQNWALEYKFTGKKTLGKLTQELWDLSPDDALRMCLQRDINSTLSLREGNDKKVSAAQYSVILQVVAILLLSIAFVCELTGHH